MTTLRRILGFVILLAPALHAQSFQGMGFLSGDAHSVPLDVSADGSVVVGGSSEDRFSNSQPFRWTPEDGMVRIDFGSSGIISGSAGAVSADGAVLVGCGLNAEGTRCFPFKWTPASGVERLYDTGIDAFVFGVSPDGSVAVGQTRDLVNDRVVAYMWPTDGGTGRALQPNALPTSSNSYAEGFDVTASGSMDTAVVVGYDAVTYGFEAARWSPDGLVGLGDLPGQGTHSAANAISADGSTIVGEGYGEAGFEAFVWTEAGGMTGLGTLNGAGDSRAKGVSADGRIVVGGSYDRTIGDWVPFVWSDATGMLPLQDLLTGYGLGLTGWTLNTALAISDNGRVIVGVGVNPDGLKEAWRAEIDERFGSVAAEVVPLVGVEASVAPNPAQGTARLHLSLDTPHQTRITVIDALGRELARLHDGPLAAGAHAFQLGSALRGPGVYLVLIQTDRGSTTRRAFVIR